MDEIMLLVSTPRQETLPGGRERPLEARDAFQELYRRHSDEVYTYLLRLLRDASLAEDALQETFLRAYRNLDQHDPGRPFRSWLFRIARNAAFDLQRRRKKQERLADAKAKQPGGGGEEDVVSEASQRESIERARAALARLSLDDRSLLLLRHVHGLKLAELSDSLACTERTVRNRLKRRRASDR